MVLLRLRRRRLRSGGDGARFLRQLRTALLGCGLKLRPHVALIHKHDRVDIIGRAGGLFSTRLSEQVWRQVLAEQENECIRNS